MISVLYKAHGALSSKYLLDQATKSNIKFMPSLISPLSINVPTSSYKLFSLFSISSSIFPFSNLPLNDLLIKAKLRFMKLPYLPNNSPLWVLIKSFQVKLKSLFSGSLDAK